MMDAAGSGARRSGAARRNEFHGILGDVVFRVVVRSKVDDYL
jgi:hypothetical protein